jgi:hypothetical protein
MSRQGEAGIRREVLPTFFFELLLSEPEVAAVESRLQRSRQQLQKVMQKRRL